MSRGRRRSEPYLRLGERQREVLAALDRGAVLVERVGSRESVRGRRAWRHALLTEGDRETPVRLAALDRLLDRGVLVRLGDRPALDCRDPETREVRVALAPAGAGEGG